MWEKLKTCGQWFGSVNSFGRNSGVGACFFFGMEAIREWTMAVLLPAMAHPWLILMLGIISAMSGLVHRIQAYRGHPVALAEEIQEASPELVNLPV
jgi:hypothetical protein